MNDKELILMQSKKSAQAQGVPASALSGGHDPAIHIANESERFLMQRSERIADIGDAITKNTAQLIRSHNEIASMFPKLEKQAREHIAKVNDLAGKVAQSLAKSKTMMGEGIEHRLLQLERFVDCMERMKKLEDDGTLARIAPALKP